MITENRIRLSLERAERVAKSCRRWTIVMAIITAAAVGSTLWTRLRNSPDVPDRYRYELREIDGKWKWVQIPWPRIPVVDADGRSVDPSDLYSGQGPPPLTSMNELFRRDMEAITGNPDLFKDERAGDPD